MGAPPRVDRTRRPEFDAVAMPQPSHIYASTLHRRGRRWSRRRTAWTGAVRGLAALSAVLVIAGALLLDYY